MFRWKDALAAYRQVLEMDDGSEEALQSIELTRSLAETADKEGLLSPENLERFHGHLLSQGRVDEAVALLQKMTEARRSALFEPTWAAYFAKNKLGKFQVLEDQSLQVDLRRSRFRGERKFEKLRRAPVSGLDLAESTLEDAAALEGLLLKRLVISHTHLGNIEPLSRLPLEELSMAYCSEVEDLAPIQGMGVKKLDLQHTRVSDLRPLVGSSLRELNLQGCDRVVDLHPLMQMTGLEAVQLPDQLKDIRFLRDHPTLKRISHHGASEPVDVFWAHFDEKSDAARAPGTQGAGEP